ncbi:MAG: hypothetical protein K0Q90_4137 [Paenibacillaceae bacterium]|nr:hypothetical protein [Paenibacillaceae bacterium]
MYVSRILKLFGLIAVIAAANIAALSPGLMGLNISGGTPVERAAGITLVVLSALVLVYGSYSLLLRKAPTVPLVLPTRPADSREDYIAALQAYKGYPGLREQVALAADQSERMDKKKAALFAVLGSRFSQEELSYRKFSSVILAVERLFDQNVKGMYSNVSLLSASGLASAKAPPKSSRFSGKLQQEKLALYQEYLGSVDGFVQANEEILLKLDKLLLEISRLETTDYRELEATPCMQEIDDLIHQTKFYKT